MEMEMTRDELNKMTKCELLEHLGRHGLKPYRQNILKRNIIDLIIKGGFNKPPPVIIHECSSCEGSIYQGEPTAKFFCMSGWTCQYCLPDCKHLLKCPDTIKRNFTDSEEAKDDSEGELNQLD